MPRICLLLAILIGFALSSTATCQSTQPELETRLVKKPLYLRGFWRDDKLKFDASGQLVGGLHPGSFTLAGIEVHSVRLKRDRLQVSGDRVGLEFENLAPKRVKLNEGIQIEVAMPASQNYGPALDAIFANDLAEIARDLPPYWQSYARANILHVAPEPKPIENPAARETNAMRIGGGITAPRPTAMPEPAYSAEGKAMKLAGTVLVYLWVDREGKPTHLRILRPLGLGLDEQALGSVASYAFRPAMRGGEPVVVEMNVEVNFQLY